MITVPESFRTGSAAAHAGAAGHAWLDALPALVDRLCAAWGLIVDGEPRHGGSSLALRCSNTRLARSRAPSSGHGRRMAR